MKLQPKNNIQNGVAKNFYYPTLHQKDHDIERKGRESLAKRFDSYVSLLISGPNRRELTSRYGLSIR